MISDNFMGMEVFFREDTSDVAVINHSFLKDIFFPAIPDFLEKPRMNIIDIGAHIGTFSLLSAVKFPDAKIFAFEPNAESFTILAKNIHHNHITNINALNIALTDKSGMVELYLDEENWGHSTAFKLGEKIELIRSEQLDNFLEEEHIEKVDLVKFNCEGAEFDIVNTMSATTLKKVGMMLILYHEDLTVGPKKTVKDLMKFLNRNGFYCRVVNKRDQRGWLIAKNSLYYKRSIKGMKNIKILFKELRTSLTK